ncbi:MAG TPA: hypothetical protein VEH06_07215 [Candidatus Bathyarchaeia archaeon]|nr:hypothetical protein [Candidatus Bathyarchaeia archaeon]
MENSRDLQKSLQIYGKSNTSISSAAELLMDVLNPFLIYESNENETPWDIVMKLLRSEDLTGKT